MRTAGVMSSVWVPEVIPAELKTVIGRSHDYMHRGEGQENSKTTQEESIVRKRPQAGTCETPVFMTWAEEEEQVENTQKQSAAW